MKKILLAVVVVLNTNLFANLSLNKYGHLNYSAEIEEAKYYIEDGEYYIELDGSTLIGNSLFKINNGYFTLTGEHENLPTWLRIYDKSGNLFLTKELKKIINTSISENGKYIIFFDGKNLQVLDIVRQKFSSYQKSIQFAINNSGIPLFVDQENKIHYNDQIFTINENICSVLFQHEIPLIFTEHSIFQIDQKLQKIHTFTEDIFEVKFIDNKLYIVLQSNSNFSLHEFTDFHKSESIDGIKFNRDSNRIHEPIYAPLNYGEENYPFPIGNSYAEIQQYGGTPYLHPGVDFLGEDFQEVYAVHDGFVKAVLTTGGDPYWRVAIANENVPSETEGYLYAHLNQNSITVNVGDEVLAGDLLGTLYPWNYFDFTHIHFARIFCTGAQWYGDWWTTENNLFDVVNIQDTIPPIFEDALNNEKFAFRNSTSYYLDPLNLNGEFDIIAKCYDQANHWYWKIDIHDLSYSLHPIENPDSILFQKFAYVYDFDLDTYINSNVDWMILNTIYSRDATCYSVGNYEEREYYHIITNSNGDSLITEDDAAEIFDSTQFDDGFYYFKVTARDACLNTTVDSMLVSFNNGVNTDNNQVQIPDCELRNYPNPFNPSTTIAFSLTKEITEDTELSIYNTKGQKVKTFPINSSTDQPINFVTWNSTDDDNNPVSSGIYFYKLRIDGKNIKTKKMILLK